MEESPYGRFQMMNRPQAGSYEKPLVVALGKLRGISRCKTENCSLIRSQTKSQPAAHNAASKSGSRSRSVRVMSVAAGDALAGASPQGGIKSRSRAQ